MDRHPDDKPKLIKDEQDFIRYVDEEMRPWPWYPREGTNRSTYLTFKRWIEHPLEYPCMVFSYVSEMDFTPGFDFETHYIYMEDARDLIIASVLHKSGVE